MSLHHSLDMFPSLFGPLDHRSFSSLFLSLSLSLSIRSWQGRTESERGPATIRSLQFDAAAARVTAVIVSTETHGRAELPQSPSRGPLQRFSQEPTQPMDTAPTTIAATQGVWPTTTNTGTAMLNKPAQLNWHNTSAAMSKFR